MTAEAQTTQFEGMEVTPATPEPPIKAPRPSMDDLNDGIITGKIQPTKKACEVCGKETRCVLITDVVLPGGIESSNRLILFYEQMDGEDQVHMAFYDLIGIGCGCYAKAHRQLSHIKTQLLIKAQFKLKRR